MLEQSYISHNLLEIENLIFSFRKNKEFLDLSREFKKELGIPDHKLIIMTGHQPIIFYPGIFIKLILADEVARKFNGNAYYLVLNHDTESIYWKYIDFIKGEYIRREILLNSSKQILLNQNFTSFKKNLLISYLKEWQYKLYHIFAPHQVPQIQYFLEESISILQITDKIYEFSVKINEKLIEYLGLKIQPLYVSDLSNTKSFLFVVELLKKNYKKFLSIYNQSLEEFRKKNQIKNPLYPFRNLKENELPFWKSDGFYKETLTLNDKIHGGMIFPKAFSLSLCIRLFLSDLMIHGLGGNIYDQVTKKILNEFFSTEISPHIIVTTTLPLPLKASIPIISESSKKIKSTIRKHHFNPEIFLNDSCFLKKQKLYLIHLKNYYDFLRTGNKKFKFDAEFLNQLQIKSQFKELYQEIEKNPECYGALIHKQMEYLNHKMHLYTLRIKRQLKQRLLRAYEVEDNQRIFFERTYPVFYYDLKYLKKITTKYLNR